MKSVLPNVLLVGSVGFAGAVLRYGLRGLVHRQLPSATFPYGTLTVNIVGCTLIGAFMGLADSRQLFGPELRTVALVGFLGGFTTDSTLGFETIGLVGVARVAA